MRERVQVPTRCAPEHRHQRRFGDAGDLADGENPSVAKLPRGHRPDAPEPLDREPVEKGQLAVRRHDEQTVGLGDAAGHLGEELGPRDADRDGQPDLFPHLAPEAHGDLGGSAGEASHPANVEERLVDGQPLDRRAGVFEDAKHRPARLGVGGHARLDDDHVRAEATRGRAAHRRPDAVGLGLVGRRQHDTAADHHRPSAKARIVPLLDGGEERVDVRVEDRRLGHSEHMFARRNPRRRILDPKLADQAVNGRKTAN